MADSDMVKGFFLKTPNGNAPDFVKRKVSVNVQQFIEYLQNNSNESDFVNFDLNEARSGHWYLKLDTFKPDPNFSSQGNNSTGNNSYNSSAKDVNAGNNQKNSKFGSYQGGNNKPSYENYPSGRPKNGGGNFEDDIPF